MNDDLVERVARVISEQLGDDWDDNVHAFCGDDWGLTPEGSKETCRTLARSAIAVVLEEAAKVADGYHHTVVKEEDYFDDGNITFTKGHTLVDPRKIAAAIRKLKGDA